MEDGDKITCVTTKDHTEVSIDATISAIEFVGIIGQIAHSLYNSGCANFGVEVMAELKNELLVPCLEHDTIFVDDETTIKNFDQWEKEVNEKQKN